jgi:hypothetical protein
LANAPAFITTPHELSFEGARDIEWVMINRMRREVRHAIVCGFAGALIVGAPNPGEAAKRKTAKPRGVEVCPRFRSAERGTLPSAITELSGLALSKRYPDLLWGHNDSGDGARLFAISTIDGTLRAEMKVTGVSAVDWEDIATYTDKKGDHWIVVADVGDNAGRRSRVQLVMVPEPDLTESTVPAAGVVTVQWVDGPHDVETLMIDPLSGDALLLGKRFADSPEVPIDRIPGRSMKPGAAITAERVGTFAVPLGQPYGPTGGSISADGTRFALTFYGNLTRTYTHDRGETVTNTLQREKACSVRTGFGQYEAVAIANDGTVFAAMEGESVPLMAFVAR